MKNYMLPVLLLCTCNLFSQQPRLSSKLPLALDRWVIFKGDLHASRERLELFGSQLCFGMHQQVILQGHFTLL